jgi:hypothetical protein
MIRRTARQGVNAGRDFWGCTRYPIDGCPGKIDIGVTSVVVEGPGSFAQREFEHRRRVRRLKFRAILPLIVAISCLTGFAVFLAALPLVGWFAGPIGGLACLAGGLVIFRMPPDVLRWSKGAQGERQTGKAIDPLLSRGFVAFYGREMPDGRGDIDAIAVGPTGVWVIETKNLSGPVEIQNGKLWVKDRDRQGMVQQVYREAFAVQQIVGELLAPFNTMVRPVLCIHGTRTPRLDHSVAGVQVASGGQLAQLLGDGPKLLDSVIVQKVAAAVDRSLREPWASEEDQ